MLLLRRSAPDQRTPAVRSRGPGVDPERSEVGRHVDTRLVLQQLLKHIIPLAVEVSESAPSIRGHATPHLHGSWLGGSTDTARRAHEALRRAGVNVAMVEYAGLPDPEPQPLECQCAQAVAAVEHLLCAKDCPFKNCPFKIWTYRCGSL